jgi:hypothetical protein
MNLTNLAQFNFSFYIWDNEKIIQFDKLFMFIQIINETILTIKIKFLFMKLLTFMY